MGRRGGTSNGTTLTLCICTAIASAGCVSAGESDAYYEAARQAELVSAASQSFRRINLPLEEISESVVRSRKVRATDVWSPEEMRTRLECDKSLKEIDPESVVMTMQARVTADPKSNIDPKQPTDDGRTLYDTKLNLQIRGKAMANGKSTDCSIAPQFAQQVIDDIASIVGKPARRTAWRPMKTPRGGTTVIKIGGG